MKPRGLLFVAVAVLVVTAFSAASAAAQDAIQQSASPNLAVPNDTGTFDTGTKQSGTFVPGETRTNSAQQKLEPNGKQPRERPARNNKDDATPTEAAPDGSNYSANPGGSGGSGDPSNSSGGTPPKELPRSSGPSFLLPVGVLLLGSGILASALLRRR